MLGSGLIARHFFGRGWEPVLCAGSQGPKGAAWDARRSSGSPEKPGSLRIWLVPCLGDGHTLDLVLMFNG